MAVLKGKSTVLLWGVIVAGFLSVPFIASAGTIRKPPANLGLTLYLPMNEGQGTTVGDASGNARNYRFTTGPTTAPPVWTSGKRGKALNFNGTSTSLTPIGTVRASTVMSAATGTISVWVRPAGTGNAATYVFDANAVLGDGGGYLGIHQGIVDGVDRLWIYNYSGNTDQKIGTSYVVGEWTHLVWMHASGTLYAYKNGVLVGSTASGDTDAVNGTLTIGKAFGNVEFNGDIDEVRTYNRELSASEIMSLYQTGAAKIGRTNQSPGTLSQGLMGHWTFDGPDMTSYVVDKSGRGNTGYLVNYTSTTTSPGALGQALNFASASSQYVNVPNTSGDLDPSESFSTSFWYKGRAGNFVSDTGNASSGFWVVGVLGSSGRYYLASESLGALTYGNFPLPNDTAWHHVALTFDRSTSPDTPTVYVDGVVVAITGSSASIDDEAIPSSVLRIGSTHSFISGYRNGPLDDVRYYNRVLSASEVVQLYRMGETKVAKTGTPSGSLTSGLVAHYTFDGKDMYNNVADVSGNGYNGTISGQTATSTVIGKIGQALNFDGTNDYVDLGDRSAFEPSGSASFSVAFWYKGLKGSTEYFVSHSPSVATNYWFVNSGTAHVCGGNGCGAARLNNYTLPSDNDWHHLTVVLDRSTNPDSLNVYLDGVSTGTQSGSLNGNSTTWGTNTRIGSPYWATSGYRQGPMDDVRFYNRALTAAEAKQLYLLGK